MHSSCFYVNQGFKTYSSSFMTHFVLKICIYDCKTNQFYCLYLHVYVYTYSEGTFWSKYIDLFVVTKLDVDHATYVHWKYTYAM